MLGSHTPRAQSGAARPARDRGEGDLEEEGGREGQRAGVGNSWGGGQEAQNAVRVRRGERGSASGGEGQGG